jgi:hypothetical protein
MATTVNRPVKPRIFSRPDDVFFTGMSILLLLIVVAGFGPTYFYRGAVLAPLPSPLVHIHGAVFSCWILLFVTQTVLVSTGNVRLHRKLGYAGATLAGLMVVLGILTIFAMVRRDAVPHIFTPEMLLALDCLGVLLFGSMVAWAVRVRNNRAEHKRIMLLATIGIMPPAITRFILGTHLPGAATGIVLLVLVLSVVVFDIWTRRKPYRATVICGVLVMDTQPISTALSHTPFLHHLVVWAHRP